MKYRKKPIVVDAIQWKGDNAQEIANNFPELISCKLIADNLLSIEYPEKQIVFIGQYIVKSTLGYLFVFSKEDFEKIYEAVDDKDKSCSTHDIDLACLTCMQTAQEKYQKLFAFLREEVTNPLCCAECYRTRLRNLGGKMLEEIGGL